MATGPQHYTEAEQLVKLVQRHPDSSDALALATAAQVHATLALAAATALNDGRDGMLLDTYEDWRKTAEAN